MSLLAFDLGTSSLKALLVDETGQVLRELSVPYCTQSPHPQWSEIDPDVWWQAVGEVCRQLEADERAQVAHVVCTGQMHTTVFINAAGQSVRPAILWNDTRACAEAAALKDAFAELETGAKPVYQQIPTTGCAATSLAWLQDHEPENFAEIHRFLVGPDYVTFKLTNCLVTNYCEASTSGLFDAAACTWSRTRFERAHLDLSIAPQIRGAAELVATLTSSAARQLKLPSEARVYAGTGDNPASFWAATGSLSGRPLLSLGTSCVLMTSVPTAAAPAVPTKGKQVIESLDGTHMHAIIQGVVQASGDARAWIEGLLDSPTHEAFDLLSDQAARSDELFYVPHLTGEKTLYANPALRGAFVGLSPQTSKADLAFAFMEGSAFGIRALMQALGVKDALLAPYAAQPLQIVGGAAQNRTYMQLLADVLGMTLCIQPTPPSPALGVAQMILHQLGARGKNSSTSPDSTVHLITPNLSAHAHYKERFARYEALVEALNIFYQQ